MAIEKVSVIGAGVMGMGIAQALAQQGLEVPLYDLERSILERSLERTRKNLESLVNKEKITAQEAEKIILKGELKPEKTNRSHKFFPSPPTFPLMYASIEDTYVTKNMC